MTFQINQPILLKAQVMLVCFLAVGILTLLSSCVTLDDLTNARKASNWSIRVKNIGGKTVVVTKSSLRGDNVIRKYALGDYREVARSGIFELGMIPVVSLGEVESPTRHTVPCALELDKDWFKAIGTKLQYYLEPLPNSAGIRFSIISVPPNTKLKIKDRTEITAVVPVRLAFSQPHGHMSCDDWWVGSVTKLIHEFAHVYIELVRLNPPNLLSNEVVAHSLVRCALLANKQPAQIFPDWKVFNNMDIDFEKTYEDLVSGKSVRAGPGSREATTIAGALTDLQFYELLGRDFPSTLSQDQAVAIEKYCRYVIVTSHDFTNATYFN